MGCGVHRGVDAAGSDRVAAVPIRPMRSLPVYRLAHDASLAATDRVHKPPVGFLPGEGQCTLGVDQRDVAPAHCVGWHNFMQVLVAGRAQAVPSLELEVAAIERLAGESDANDVI
jgi:hypothetical protein